MDDQLKELKEAMAALKKACRCLYIAVDESVANDVANKVGAVLSRMDPLIAALESERAGRVRAERALDKLVRDLNDECRLLDSQSDALDAEDPDRQFLDGRYNAKAEVGSRVFQFRTGLTETLESHRELSDRLKAALAQSPPKETKP